MLGVLGSLNLGIFGLLGTWNLWVLEAADLGGIAGVFAVLATSIPVRGLSRMELQARGLAARGVHMWHTELEGADQQLRNN